MIQASANQVIDTDGLVAVRGALRLDEARLKSYLGRFLPGLGGPITVSRFKGGQSNPTYCINTPENAYVLRKKPPGKLLPSAHAVDREYRVLQALADTGVPVPRVVHFCEDHSVIGTPFYVMEFLHGRILRNPQLPGMNPSERTAIYAAMNDTLTRLHTLDWKAAGLEDYGKPDNYLARQVALWKRQYEASKTQDVAAMDQLMNWLPDHIPADDSVSVVHGDYRLENLMFDETEARVIAVLDWELSTLGHPLSDLAYNCMTYYMPSDSALANGFVGYDIARMGIPSEKDYVSAYCRRTGREDIADWNFFMAFSLFRIAAIQQGVYARSLKGNASSEVAPLFGKLYPFVAEQGCALLQKTQ